MKKIFVVLIFCLFCFCSCNRNKYDFVNEPFTIEYCYKFNSDFTEYHPLVTVKYDGNDFITHYYEVFPKKFVGASIPPYKIFPEDSVNDEIEHITEYDDTVCYYSDTLKDVRITRDGDHIRAYDQMKDGHYLELLDGYFGKK